MSEPSIKTNRPLHPGHLPSKLDGSQKMTNAWYEVLLREEEFKDQVIGKLLSEASLFKVWAAIHYGLCNQFSKCDKILIRWYHMEKIDCVVNVVLPLSNSVFHTNKFK